MKNRNRWVMLVAILLAIIAVALDYLQHPVSETSDDMLDSIADEHEGAPCSMDGMHAEEEDDEEEL